MGDLTPNFSSTEFTCECGCGFGLQDTRLAEVLQRLRDYLNETYEKGITIIISGRVRCAAHNATIKGAAPKSKHIEGIACDFKTKNRKIFDPKMIYATYPES